MKTMFLRKANFGVVLHSLHWDKKNRKPLEQTRQTSQQQPACMHAVFLNELNQLFDMQNQTKSADKISINPTKTKADQHAKYTRHYPLATYQLVCPQI